MTIAKTVAWVGVLAMTIVLIFAFIKGDFSKDGAAMLANPWGIVSMVDLYVGFAIFSAWIVYRESSATSAIFWVLCMMILGFFTGALYTLITLYKSNGDWNRFFKGAKA
jgi:hypothetical protein